jgi:dienelactone hydrolase
MVETQVSTHANLEHEVSIAVENTTLKGNLAIPPGATQIVLFAHGSGSSRHSPRNRFVAEVLQNKGIATLLFDLLTRKEEIVDDVTAELRFDIPFLAERLIGATHWVQKFPATKDMKVGYFGASTGAAAALVAAAQLPETITAVVSRGGRPDLAHHVLADVKAPTLLIVGGDDEPVIGMNGFALGKLGCAEKKMMIIPGATHLFEEPGTLEEVARLAADWFAQHAAISQEAGAVPQAARCFETPGR